MEPRRGRVSGLLAAGCLVGLQAVGLLGALVALPALVGVRLLWPRLAKAMEGADPMLACQAGIFYALALVGLGLFVLVSLLLFAVCFIGFRLLRRLPPPLTKGPPV